MNQIKLNDFIQDGFAIFPHFLEEDEILKLVQATSAIPSTNARNLFRDYAAIKDFARSPKLLDAARQILGFSPCAIKATYFNKTSETNWKVPAHQDVTITVANRLDVPGFGPWTIKDGINNVQPPQEVLEQIVAFRFHLDDCDNDNGALRVWPGSHRFGRLKDQKLQALISTSESSLCPVPAGGLMIMRPLLVHASSVSKNPSHRRVIHIEYTAYDLPGGLRWQDEIN